MRVARSRGARMTNSSGVSSMNVVVASPDLNVGWPIRFSRNAMLVLTPRMRNSRSARSPRCAASSSVAAPGGDLHQQRIEVRRDDRAAEAVAAVEPHGEAAGRSVGRDAAVVGDEMPIGILGGDAALHRDAAAFDLRPAAGCRQRRLVQPVAAGDEDLAAHEVDAGDHLGDRVLDLDARVDLDEEELAALDVEQELDGAGAAVADRPAQPRRGVADRASAARLGRLMLGATSTTFWWRRWTEQSRSHRCTRLPCASPRICTSMCFAVGM